MYVALKTLVYDATKGVTVQLSVSVPYLLQDDENQICLLILSKIEAQTLCPGEFVCIRQEEYNGEYMVYDNLGLPMEAVVAGWIDNDVRIAF